MQSVVCEDSLFAWARDALDCQIKVGRPRLAKTRAKPHQRKPSLGYLKIALRSQQFHDLLHLSGRRIDNAVAFHLIQAELPHFLGVRTAQDVGNHTLAEPAT